MLYDGLVFEVLPVYFTLILLVSVLLEKPMGNITYLISRLFVKVGIISALGLSSVRFVENTSIFVGRYVTRYCRVNENTKGILFVAFYTLTFKTKKDDCGG
jgi:hypothetical protein